MTEKLTAEQRAELRRVSVYYPSVLALLDEVDELRGYWLESVKSHERLEIALLVTWPELDPDLEEDVFCEAVKTKLAALLRRAESAETELAALKSPQPCAAWVPCAERLPEDGAPVWFISPRGDVSRGAFASGATQFSGYFISPGWRWASEDITHWMPRVESPMPAPPKGSE